MTSTVIKRRISSSRIKVYNVEDVNNNVHLKPKHFVKFSPNTCLSRLVVHNTTDKQILFKIETTSPDVFKITPRLGLLDANKTTKINSIFTLFLFETKVNIGIPTGKSKSSKISYFDSILIFSG
jgi:hypothetical protein